MAPQECWLEAILVEREALEAGKPCWARTLGGQLKNPVSNGQAFDPLSLFPNTCKHVGNVNPWPCVVIKQDSECKIIISTGPDTK